MKLITLNTWGGRVKDPLHNFLKSYSGDIDIFCLQEVYHNGIEEEVEGGVRI